MRKALACLAACSLLLMFSCGVEEAPPGPVEESSQVEQFPTVDELTSDDEIGEIEQSLSCTWQIASSKVYRQCSCGGLPQPWGYYYQPCSPCGATKRTCWSRYLGGNVYCFVWDLKCQ